MASPAISAISKMSNDELHRLGVDELIHLLRKSEQDRLQLLAEHNNLMKDVNRKMQVLFRLSLCIKFLERALSFQLYTWHVLDSENDKCLFLVG